MVQQIQLIFLPFAGGNSLSFKKILPFIDRRISSVTVEYAGRLTRCTEKFIDDYDEFLDDVAAYISRRRNNHMPCAIFGYSLGSMIAYDLITRGLIDGEMLHVFLCAKGSLKKTQCSVDYRNMSNQRFVKEIFSLGGVDKRLLRNKRFRDIYMAPVRADYIVLSQYSYVPSYMFCDATAIYSKKDPATQGVHDWSKLVNGNIDYYEMGTNHFFINQYWKQVAGIINLHLAKYLK